MSPRLVLAHGVVVALVGLVGCGLAFGGEIHDAAERGDLDRVKALLEESPALLSSTNDSGQTPLHRAASGGVKETVEFLLAKHADINARTDNGFTPLHSAALNGNEDIVELLLDHQAEVNAADKNGLTPLHYAVEQHCDETAEILRQHGGHDHFTELRDFIVKSDVEKAKALLALDPAAALGKDQAGTTPLHGAVVKGPKEMVESLLDCQADVNAPGADGMTPLYLAVAAGQLEIVTVLLDKGADPNRQTRKTGFTPLHVAVAAGRKDIVDLLLQHHADPNAREAHQVTSLLLATLLDRKDIVETLLDHRAEVNARNSQDETALAIAETNGFKETASLLRLRGGQVFEKLVRHRSF